MPRNHESPELSVVMPVYDEARVLAGVLSEWVAELDRLGVGFELRAYDDGSSDATPEILAAAAAADPRIVPVRQANRGHGPAVLRGFREARGAWVFQTDGDGELPAGAFAQLWRRREDFDVLMGWRRGRRAPIERRLVTATARLLVYLLFGPGRDRPGIRDVNVPYRLYRRAALERLLARVPAGAFAPNVILSGLAVGSGLRIHQRPVDFRPRRQGPGSLTPARLMRGALRASRELLSTALGSR